jgi:uncharacterized membrane protein YphA (DoxX/SURF4 family)
MKIITQIVRFLVALTFIFSGFVKMIDPIGTKIKMLEYFSEDVLNLTFLRPFTLEISIFLILLEFVLGIWLIIGYKPKFTLKALLILILFFLFLTGYSAIFNKVTDCGCFGDAVKLTNWETFYKNIILLLLILFLNWQQVYIKPFFSKSITSVVAYTMVLLSLFLMIYTVKHLPIIDFRPYAIGKNINEGMQIPPNAPKAKFKDIWYYKVNGKVQEFTNDDEPWNIPNAEFVDRKTITLQEGYIPPIHDFSIENDLVGDITQGVLQTPEIYLIISSDPAHISPDAQKIINNYALKLHKKGKQVIGLFAIIDDDISDKFVFPLYLTDATTLKTMIRSNPGVIKLEKGTVREKKAWHDLD